MRRAILGAVLTVLAVSGAFVARGAAEQAGATKEFSVTSERSQFTPNTIEVKQGDHVKISFTTKDSTHGFEIKKLKIKKVIERGPNPTILEFDAKEAGTFEFACSEYCGKGHDGMKGKLIVSP